VIGKLTLLVVLYGGLSVAALLLLLIGVALARRRAEVVLTAAIASLLVAAHAVELYYLSDMGRAWGGDGDQLLLAGGATIGVAAALAIAAFVFLRLNAAAFRDDMK
jgi:hypothetical protein